MSLSEQSPVETHCEQHGESSASYEHPAFGKVVVTRTQGRAALFGSDLEHLGSINISLHKASLHRRSNSDRISQGNLICEFDMSAAQFAQMITSQGDGQGTPCTLRYGPDANSKLVAYPGIKKIESKADILRREVRESALEQIKKVQKSLQEVKSLSDAPTISKKSLREALFNLQCMIDNLPSNMAFTVSSAERALENAVTAAKIEMESFVAVTTRRLGEKSLRELQPSLLEQKSNSGLFEQAQ
jgi:hypothetical protein